MIRVRLFLMIFAICIAAESSPLVERTKREADGGKIECYIGNDFKETIKVADGNCGYTYGFLTTECDGQIPHPETRFFSQEQLIFSKRSTVYTFLYVQCKCDGEKCNEKDKFPECITKVVESGGSIYKDNVNETELDEMVQCAMKTKSLTYKELFEARTTRTKRTTITTETTTSTTSKEITKTMVADNSSVTIDNLMLAIIIIAIVLVTVGSSVVMFCMGKRVGKNSKSAQSKALENGAKSKPKLVKLKDTVTTPTHLSGTPMQNTTVSQAKTSEDEFGPNMTSAEASADRSSARTMDRSVVKTNAPGSSVKSSAKSVIKSTASMRTEGRSVGKKSAKDNATEKSAKTKTSRDKMSRKITSDKASADRSSARTMDRSVDKTSARGSSVKSNAKSVLASYASTRTEDKRSGKSSKSARVANGAKTKQNLVKSKDNAVTTKTTVSGTPTQSTVSQEKTSEESGSADDGHKRTRAKAGSAIKSVKSAKCAIKSTASLSTEDE